MVSGRGILGPLKVFLEEKWVRINYQFISNIFPDHVPDLQIITLNNKVDNFLKHLLDSLKICLLENIVPITLLFVTFFSNCETQIYLSFPV